MCKITVTKETLLLYEKNFFKTQSGLYCMQYERVTSHEGLSLLKDRKAKERRQAGETKSFDFQVLALSLSG